MKLQHLTIIFIIIILPISLVLSEYIQAKIDTILMQTQYSKRLQDATYDALKAFQLNTINNKYSSESDSKIRDIQASINTFYNSFATSMGTSGMDKEMLQEHIPAMVYTLYDGYYIYGKYYNYSIASGQQGYQYGLKPFIYYACRYQNGGDDFVINYTLDNSITVYGNIGGKYVTKSGYVIDPGLVTINTSSDYINVSEIQSKLTAYDRDKYGSLDYGGIYSQIKYPIHLKYGNTTSSGIVDINKELLTEELVTYEEPQSDFPDYISLLTSDTNTKEVKSNYFRAEYEYTFYNNQKIYKDNIKTKSGKIRYFLYNKNRKQYLSDAGKVITSEQYRKDDGTMTTIGEITPLMYAVIMTEGDHLYSNSGVEYYQKAAEFSKWLNTNLHLITQGNARDAENNTITFSTNTGGKYIFQFGSGNDPLLEGSTFNEHRLSVIKYSIESNLKSAIANFNIGASGKTEFQMPVLNEEDWDKLLNNVSLSVFLQGLPLKSKIFNSYCVLTNNKNKEVVTKNSIYIIEKNKTTKKTEAHMPGCQELAQNHSISNYEIVGAYSLVDFERQSIAIDGVDKYFFYPRSDYKCYSCIVNVPKAFDIDNIIEGKLMQYNPTTDTYTQIPKDITKLRTVYLTALGRARYDLYRTNGYM